MNGFPSPLGVIFSLIYPLSGLLAIRVSNLVSVSSRSYILSYPINSESNTPTTSLVSVSSRSYILSYLTLLSARRVAKAIFKFPSPLGVIFSLIIIVNIIRKKRRGRVSVSSRSYILSYLKKENISIKILKDRKFPSPLGVIFSLMLKMNGLGIYVGVISFRLLSELYSLLYN